MLTTTAAGRTWSFSHAIGRNAGAGNGFSQPNAVAKGPDGVLYVVSRGIDGSVAGAATKRIGRLTMDEEFLGDFGQHDFTWPGGLAVDRDGNVYCSDEHANFIASYTADGERRGQWGESGSGEGQLDGPSGLAFDADDNLCVVDSRNARVQRFTRDGQFQTAWGSHGSGDAELSLPWGIAIDGDGDVYVADWGNDRVQKFSPDGEFIMSFGSANGDGGDLDHPADVAVDSEGDVYVSDWGNKRVQIFDPEGGILTALRGDAHEFSKWAKGVVEANPDVVKAYRRVSDVTSLGRLNRPRGLIVDEQDRIIITDGTRGRLQVYIKEKDYLEAQYNL